MTTYKTKRRTRWYITHKHTIHKTLITTGTTLITISTTLLIYLHTTKNP